MKNLFIATISILTIVLAGCGDPKGTVIPSDMSKWDTDLKPSIAKLSEEDKKLFAGYIMRAKMGEAFGGKGVTEGTTIGQGIEQQKKWMQEQEIKAAEQRALKEKIQKERVETTKKINDAVTIAVTDLHLEKERFEEKQIIKIALQNKGTQDITGVKGKIKFIDIFDKEVGSIAFSYDDGIKAGETATWSGARRYNQFIAEHKAIANLQEGKYKTIFEPEAIVYADGKKISISE